MCRLARFTGLILFASCVVGCADKPAAKPAVKLLPLAAPAKPPVKFTVRHQGRFREQRFLRNHDRFVSEDAPQVVAADEADFLNDDDEVLGFVIDGQPRAYSVRMLSYHHVVNDKIGDSPLAVTY